MLTKSQAVSIHAQRETFQSQVIHLPCPPHSSPLPPTASENLRFGFTLTTIAILFFLLHAYPPLPAC